MKKHFIFLLLLSLPIIINVQAQEGSRDLLAEYCTKNWIRDLDKCVDYIPSDYNERKAEYQAQEAEKVRQETLQSKSETEPSRVCPVGSHLSVDNFGNQVCVDSKTNQVVSSPNTGQSDFGDTGTVIGIIVAIAIVIFIAGTFAKKKKPEPESYQDIPRRGWNELEKEQVRLRQDGKCNRCGRPPPRWEYHHRDGNRSNDSLSNCEGLCPNCHSVETHDG